MSIVINQQMDRGDGPKILDGLESLFVKQTKKGCCQELMGCEATNEFKIFPSKDQVEYRLQYIRTRTYRTRTCARTCVSHCHFSGQRRRDDVLTRGQ